MQPLSVYHSISFIFNYPKNLNGKENFSIESHLSVLVFVIEINFRGTGERKVYLGCVRM